VVTVILVHLETMELDRFAISAFCCQVEKLLISLGDIRDGTRIIMLPAEIVPAP
jgi:hypothetical protein